MSHKKPRFNSYEEGLRHLEGTLDLSNLDNGQLYSRLDFYLDFATGVSFEHAQKYTQDYESTINELEKRDLNLQASRNYSDYLNKLNKGEVKTQRN